ncbi:hypothetical protein PGT21_027868 [Puccinia graminis f. sp. tritici]|uniref:Uncharacterized protein n=1 Tax=Puccinia graminis f. sp. tritici TaxID=56615 RepID=A0A5B0RVP0_PUCGR|nr:hypothetical protein PGT21_027868 [Puccinia graminis f. sp. tritici]KAA1128923.1 hypothetical protein PGTUg99_004224 [Puccinia graminis f. sp. tritici]
MTNIGKNLPRSKSQTPDLRLTPGLISFEVYLTQSLFSFSYPTFKWPITSGGVPLFQCHQFMALAGSHH